MKTIKQTYLIKAPIREVWKALVDPKYINAWGGGPAKMEGTEGFRFVLWGGEIFGKNTQVVENAKLIQEWWDRAGKWDEPSIAEFELVQKGDKVKLTLTHANLPDESKKDIDEGWKKFYLGPLKKYLEEK